MGWSGSAGCLDSRVRRSMPVRHASRATWCHSWRSGAARNQRCPTLTFWRPSAPIWRPRPLPVRGNRKVWARLRILRDIRVSRTRVLRLMRENALLSPHRRPQGTSSLHDGTITTSRPNEMWGTDGVRIETVDDGWVWVFSAIDHCDACCVGIHAVKTGNRFAALQPIAQGLLGEFGGTGAEVGRGLTLRMDSNNGSTSFSSARPATEVVRPPEGLVPRSVPDGLTHALIDLSCCLSLDPSAGREHRTARFHLAAACDPRRA